MNIIFLVFLKLFTDDGGQIKLKIAFLSISFQISGRKKCLKKTVYVM